MCQIVWEAVQEAREEGRVEGRKEGLMEISREVAAHLLVLGVSKDIIIKSTGLNMSDVLELQASSSS